jgi:hypothetical protein
MTPDALQDPTAFAPGRIAAAPSNLAKETEATDDAIYTSLMAAGASRLALNDQVAQNTIELNYSGSLSGLLNQVAAKTRLRWTYEDDRIVFRRVITRSIVVKSLPGAIKSSGNLSISSGGGNGGTLSISSDADTDFWSALEKTLPLMVSSQGQFVVDRPLSALGAVQGFFWRHVDRVIVYPDAFRRLIAFLSRAGLALQLALDGLACA